MRIVAIVQARMGSTRFPGKVMALVDGIPMIKILLERLSLSNQINEIIVATSEKPEDVVLKNYVLELGYSCFCGNETDLMDRYLQAAQILKADTIVRITGDCPLVDPSVVDEVIRRFKATGVDYASNVSPPTYPDGLDVEVFSFDALQRAYIETDLPFNREHVTPYLRNSGKFRQTIVSNDEDLSGLRWTVDEECDFKVICNVFNYFSPNIHFSWKEVVNLQRKKPELFEKNQHIMRNEGATMTTGQKLWLRTKKKIPEGNALLFKYPDMFIPSEWPVYYKKAKGCRVWDLDEKEYIDMSIIGGGSNVLGYGHPEVDEAVRLAVDQGSGSTLSCAEEVYFAEKLLEIHPWGNMVHFARSGDEANSLALQLAQAAINNNKIALCGYHLNQTFNAYTKTLSEDLSSGLRISNKPTALSDTVFSFNYNNFFELELFINKEDIGIIRVNIQHIQPSEINFQQKIKNLATQKGIILIFDECVSGFRQSFGGLHKIYNVEPDMVVFGNTMSNGYAIAAVIGKQEFMKVAQSAFIRSSFGGDRIGYSAGLKTLEVMEKIKACDIVTQTGLEVSKRWQMLGEKHGLSINVIGLPSVINFSFNSPCNLEYKAFITQKMLEKGFLVGGSFYPCIDHTQEIVDAYFFELEKTFEILKNCEEDIDISMLLKDSVQQN